MTMQMVRNALVGVALASSVSGCSVAQGKRGAVFFGIVPMAAPIELDSNRVPNPIENPIPPHPVNPWVEPAYKPVPPPTTDEQPLHEGPPPQVAHTDPVQFTIATLIAAAFGVLPGIGLFGDW